MAAFVGGVYALLREPALRAILLRMIAVLLSLALLTGVAALALLGQGLASLLPQTDAWYIDIISGVLWLLSLSLALLLAVLVYVLLASTLLSPWLEALAQKADPTPRPSVEEGFLAAFGRSLLPIWDLSLHAMLALPFLLIPVLGAPLASVLWSYAGLRFLAFELIDIPASRRALDWRQRKAHLRRNFRFYLGFTTMAALLLLTPLLNVLTVPAAVVALSRKMDALL